MISGTGGQAISALAVVWAAIPKHRCGRAKVVMTIVFETWSQIASVVRVDLIQERNVKLPVEGKDHRGWLEHWSNELLDTIERYVRTGAPLDLEHVVRCTHSVHMRAIKLRPRLRPSREELEKIPKIR